jgi:hypothetical protein
VGNWIIVSSSLFNLGYEFVCFLFHAITSIPKDSRESLLVHPLRQTATKRIVNKRNVCPLCLDKSEGKLNM